MLVALSLPMANNESMRWSLFLFAILWLSLALARSAPPMETPSQPFDFDSYRRNPIEAKRKATYAAEGRDLQQNLLAGKKGGKSDISKEAADLFPAMESIPLRVEPQPLPTPRELTDQVTANRCGQDSKGRIDLLARSKVAKELNLSSMSENDYELYAAQMQNDHQERPEKPNLLNPMPTVTNLKTDGPAHAYSVTQAGIGARAKTGSNQNPFDDAIRFLRIDQPVTHGEDPIPAAAKKTVAPATPPPATSATQASPSAGSY
ncbi:hypothetical protein EBT11_01865 [bacterium]|nr:hypothetical protein [bacterium]NBV96974.1 hypothetical protein [Verrucomicrobiota bacterium]